MGSGTYLDPHKFQPVVKMTETFSFIFAKKVFSALETLSIFAMLRVRERYVVTVSKFLIIIINYISQLLDIIVWEKSFLSI